MKILVVAGHTITGKGTGAVGILNESAENRVVSKKVVEYLKQAGHTAVYGEVNKSDNYLAKQVALANKSKYDVVVQIHFNAFNGSASGTETYYTSSTGKKFAEQVNKKLSTLYSNRGAKTSTDLYWLNKTNAPAILVETCFIDSKSDVSIYKANIDKTALLIAEGIIGKDINISQTFYRVLVGSFNNRSYADNLVNELKSKGYSPTILPFTK